MNDILQKHKETWKKKKILKQIYSEWYSWIVSDLSKTGGQTVELGAGSGNFKEYYPQTITSDIEPHDWLDMSFDAHAMPFDNGEIGNLVMVDVLHHLADPVGFFHEAWRALRPGGRIMMVEPYPSPFSSLVYKLFHPEPFEFDTDYFAQQPDIQKKAWDSNQAIPYLLFYKNLKRFESEFKNKFVITKKKRFSFLLYPLSGGFEHRQLIPDFSIPVFKLLEKMFTPVKPIISFSLLYCFGKEIILQSKPPP